MSEHQRPSPSEIAKILQDQLESTPEPPFKTRIIAHLNTQSASRRSGIVLRIPPNDQSEYIFVKYTWTDEQAARYLSDGTLPVDHTTLDPDSVAIVLWIFDARGCGGMLPEVEMDPLPDFAARKAICVFDMNGAESVALIPSDDLETVPTGKNRVQFVLKGPPGQG